MHNIRNKQVRDYTAKPRSRTEGNNISGVDSVEGVTAAWRVARYQSHAPYRSRRGGHGYLAANEANDARVVVKPRYLSLNV
jgi:hypothetical protein